MHFIRTWFVLTGILIIEHLTMEKVYIVSIFRTISKNNYITNNYMEL